MSLVTKITALAQAIAFDIKTITQSITNGLSTKVDKVIGKQLTTNDLTDPLLASINISNDFIKDTFSGSYISGGTVSPTGGVNFSISPGSGYAREPDGSVTKVSWGNLTGACLNNGDNYIGVDHNGDVIVSSHLISNDSISLAYINTYNGNTAIAGFSNIRFKAPNHLYNMNDWVRRIIGTMVHTGTNLSLQASPNQLKVTLGSGEIWTQFNPISVSDTSTFTKLFNSLQGFVPDTTNPNTIPIGYWNDVSQNYTSALVACTPGYFVKHMFFINPEGLLFMLYGTEEYALASDALLGPEPAAPDSIRESICRIATVVVQQGATEVDTLSDIRPIFQRLFLRGVVSSPLTVVSHHDLVDNANGDDHPQYHTDAKGDVRYYRKSEITSFLLGKSDIGHTHPVSDVVGLSATLATLAVLDSPVFVGTPTAPTATPGTNTTQLANTQFVTTAINNALSNLINGAPGAMDQLSELAAALGNDPNYATTMLNSLATKLSINAVQGYTAQQQLFGRQNLALTDTQNLGEFSDKLLLTNAERTKLGQLRKNPTTETWEREFSTGVWIPFGQVIQSVLNPIPVTTGNSVIFYDNIAPVFANGFQIVTFTVTPFLSTSTIFVMYSLMLDHSTNNRTITTALFADNNLVGCASANVGTAGRPISTTFTHRFLPGSTAPVTFVIKVGANGGGTTYVNRGTNATLGGATVSTAIALEIKN